MRLTFIVRWSAIALLYVTLWKYEMTAKNARGSGPARCGGQLLGDDAVRPVGTERGAVMSALFAAAPALPLHTAGKYVAGAYIVFLLVVLDLRGDHGGAACSGPSASWSSACVRRERLGRRAGASATPQDRDPAASAVA